MTRSFGGARGGEMISEAFTTLALAETGHEPVRVRAYVVDELVLTVTEGESAPGAPRRTAAGARLGAAGDESGASQRRAIVEAVTGQHVATTLSRRASDPEVLVELFVLVPDDATSGRLGGQSAG